jgi:hypothetical protein
MPHYSHKDLKEVSIYLSEEEETLSHAFLKEDLQGPRGGRPEAHREA